MCFVDKEPMDICDYFVITVATLLALPAVIVLAIMILGRKAGDKMKQFIDSQFGQISFFILLILVVYMFM